MSFYRGFEAALGALTGAAIFLMLLPLAILGLFLLVTGL